MNKYDLDKYIIKYLKLFYVVCLGVNEAGSSPEHEPSRSDGGVQGKVFGG
jgi:hypothetical protein